ncbi:hypothetical protein [Sporosarcina sp. FSL K6-1508]|uniref:hypothetical protein n=1 Tax=Sporosarcina sp. FSL K6-1508 TaxID=2921553 RepID=UPI0030F64FA3
MKSYIMQKTNRSFILALLFCTVIVAMWWLANVVIMEKEIAPADSIQPIVEYYGESEKGS